MDEFLALIGAAPTQEEQQRRIAQLLSGRRDVGTLGALTGDRVLAPFGQNMVKQAYDSAGQIQQTRQADIDDERTAGYYKGQLDHMDSVLRETNRHNKKSEFNDLLRIMAGLEEARIRAAATSQGSGRKMTDATRNRISETSSVYEGVKGLRDGFKPNYSQILGPGPQSRLPNYAAQVGIGTENSKEAQQWWAAWSEIRTLPWRNLLFGATLTPNEKVEWAKVDINPSMSEEQIKQGINRIMAIIRRNARTQARVMQADGYDPDTLVQAYGEGLLFDEDGMEQEAATGEDEEIAALEAQIQAEIQRRQLEGGE